MIAAGRLRHSVTIEKRDEVVDVTGQRSSTWSYVCTAPAEVKPLTGRALELAQAVVAGVNHRVTIRYRAGITPAMRILYAGRVFSIEDVMDVDEAHSELQLACSEGLSDGR